MKTFSQYLADKRLNEGAVRKGAVAAFAAQSRSHGNDAVRNFQQAKQQLRAVTDTKIADQKIDALAKALSSMIDGLMATRMQIGSVSAQVTAYSSL